LARCSRKVARPRCTSAAATTRVVKLYRPGFGGYLAEAAALTMLDGANVAPRLVERVHIDGRDGLVQQRLDGVDMLASLQRQPWRLMTMARMLARAALRIHQVPAPPALPDLAVVAGYAVGRAPADVGRAFGVRPSVCPLIPQRHAAATAAPAGLDHRPRGGPPG
jgi:hypothetical protein